jgi:hypothetical protein
MTAEELAHHDKWVDLVIADTYKRLEASVAETLKEWGEDAMRRNVVVTGVVTDDQPKS